MLLSTVYHNEILANNITQLQADKRNNRCFWTNAAITEHFVFADDKVDLLKYSYKAIYQLLHFDNILLSFWDRYFKRSNKFRHNSLISTHHYDLLRLESSEEVLVFAYLWFQITWNEEGFFSAKSKMMVLWFNDET